MMPAERARPGRSNGRLSNRWRLAVPRPAREPITKQRVENQDDSTGFGRSWLLRWGTGAFQPTACFRPQAGPGQDRRPVCFVELQISPVAA